MSFLKKTFRIPDMHCSACVMKLEGLVDDLPGVRMVQASYQKQSMLFISSFWIPIYRDFFVK